MQRKGQFFWNWIADKAKLREKPLNDPNDQYHRENYFIGCVLWNMSDEQFDKIVDEYYEHKVQIKIEESKNKGLFVDGEFKNQLIRNNIEYERLPSWMKNNDYDDPELSLHNNE